MAVQDNADGDGVREAGKAGVGNRVQRDEDGWLKEAEKWSWFYQVATWQIQEEGEEDGQKEGKARLQSEIEE